MYALKSQGLYSELVYKLKGMKHWLTAENYDHLWHKSRCSPSWGSRFPAPESLSSVFLSYGYSQWI